ncbi:MAG: DUF4340 domain-containing protein [Polyangiaceae bacterium]|nr:DUF4340 domain-containing protein [Polyangiaceae bacterium]
MGKHWTTLVLVLLAIGLGVWLLRDRGKVTESERKGRDHHVFPAWRRDELTRVEIVHDGESIVLERDAKADGLWQMISPQKGHVDMAAVESLLSTLEFATVVRRISPGPELGLDAPRARATGLVAMGGLVQRFVLGRPSPRPEGSSYFRLDDFAPMVVSRELTDALVAPASTYRDRSVVPYLSLELAKFDVKVDAKPDESAPYDNHGFSLERIDDRSFRVGSEGVLASRDGVDKVWEALAEMRAESFLSDADGDKLTASPRVVLTLTPTETAKPPAEIAMGDACPGHTDSVAILRRTPSRVVACARGLAIDTFLVLPTSLVEHHLFTLHADEIEDLRLEWLVPNFSDFSGFSRGGPMAIELARKGTGFHMRAPFDRDLTREEADAATALMERIASAEAISVTRGGGARVVAPVGRARVRNGDHEEVIAIGEIGGEIGDDIGSNAENKITVLREYDDARLEVPRLMVELLLPRTTSLRPLLPVVTETRRPSQIVLRCGTPQDIADTGDGFRLVEPKGYEVDSSVVDLVNAFTRDKVEAWVSDDADNPTFGLHDSPCRVTFAFDNNFRAVLLGSKTKDGHVYGRIDGEDGVFLASGHLFDLASTLYVSRAALRVPASEITKVSATLNGLPVPPSDAMRDAVAALYADRVRSLGAQAPQTPGAGSSKTLILDITLADAGTQKHVMCNSPSNEWLCRVAGVNATFGVSDAKLAAFLPSSSGKSAPPDNPRTDEVAPDADSR